MRGFVVAFYTLFLLADYYFARFIFGKPETLWYLFLFLHVFFFIGWFAHLSAGFILKLPAAAGVGIQQFLTAGVLVILSMAAVWFGTPMLLVSIIASALFGFTSLLTIVNALE